MPVRSSSSSVLKWPDAGRVDAAVRRWAKKTAESRKNIIRIGYFGSYARGDWSVGSDLDIVMIITTSKTPFVRRAAKWDATELPVPADLLVYTEAEWSKLAEDGGQTFKTIEREARWLFEKNVRSAKASSEIPNQSNNDLRDLKVLEAIEKNSNISQRDLSQRLGVALGITNSLIKTLARKGLVKIRGKNNRSLTYHLTHAGILHKGKLAMQWTLNTIGDYRRLRGEVSEKLSRMAAEGLSKIGIYGANELAEIVILVAAEAGVEIVGIADDHPERETLATFQIGSLAGLINLAPDALVNCTDSDLKSKLARQSGGKRLYVFDLIE